MRFYYRIALVLLLVYLTGDYACGAPVTTKGKGRYMWVECKPGDNDANCLEKKGPWLDLPGPSQRLPPSATKDIVPVESSEETEESSGDLEPLTKLRDVRKADGEVEMKEPVLEEDGSGEIDYTNYVFPGRVEPKLSAADLREDNIMQ